MLSFTSTTREEKFTDINICKNKIKIKIEEEEFPCAPKRNPQNDSSIFHRKGLR